MMPTSFKRKIHIHINKNAEKKKKAWDYIKFAWNIYGNKEMKFLAQLTDRKTSLNTFVLDWIIYNRQKTVSTRKH